jgi:hypothetical protein
LIMRKERRGIRKIKRKTSKERKKTRFSSETILLSEHNILWKMTPYAQGIFPFKNYRW